MNHMQALNSGNIEHSSIDPMLLNADRWMATLAHELRDPLSFMIMSLDELESFCSSDAGAHLQRSMASEGAWHMVRVIEDVLELSRSRRGKAQPQQVVDLKQVISGAIRNTCQIMKLRNHKLSTSLPNHCVLVCGNATQLQRAITNLLTNAAKFTDPGGQIRLTAECYKSNAVLRVRDNGKGIAAEQLRLLFVPFWQEEQVVSSSMRGLGLGLSLVKMLIELNGGSISARSEGVGAGAEFSITFPISSSSATVF